MIALRRTVFFGLILGALSFVFFLSTLTAYANAQFNELAPTSITLSQKYPAPGETVVATFKANTINLKLARVVWRVNGEVVVDAVGAETFTFTVGPVGSSYAISVEAYSPQGTAVRKSTVVRIGSVGILWEADTYVPPLYPGRALLTPGSAVRVAAFVDLYDEAGMRIPENELLFEWYIDRRKGEPVSGLGLTSTTLTPRSPFDTYRVTLNIYNAQGDLLHVQSVVAPTTEPKLELYEDDPVLGVLYQRALGTDFAMVGEEMRLVAEPFFTRAQTRADEVLSYEWRLEREVLSVPGYLVLRSGGGGAGRTRLSLLISNQNLLLQRLSKNMTISFEGDSRTSSAPETTPL